MNRIRAAIFDLDGTLLESLGVWEAMDRRFLAERGIAYTPDYTEAVSAMHFAEAADYTVKRYGFREKPEEIVRIWTEMIRDEYAHVIPMKPGAKEYLASLRERGVKLGVATALSEELYSAVLRNNGVYGWFSAFASVCEGKRGKEFPDVYLLAARRLGVPPAECAVFEDIPEALRGAKAAGMVAVSVFDPRSAAKDGFPSPYADYRLLDYASAPAFL